MIGGSARSGADDRRVPAIHRAVLAIGAVALLVAACAADDDGNGRPMEIQLEKQSGDDLNALVASYDISARTPQRFVVGLVTNDQQLVSFGVADLSFSYLGTGDASGGPVPGPKATGTWQPIPGQDLGTVPDAPIVGDAVDGIGVYAARRVEFDKPGFWQVDVEVDVDGDARRAQAAFEVYSEHAVVALGDPAPRTVNHLPGAAGVPVKAVDSRAEEDGTVPDPELHELTVADAIESGKPTLLVVATPVYCVSRFCGPITDAVQALAKQFGDRMNFVHIEVWRDFEEQALNKAAAEWIYPPGIEEAKEPWVWVVDGDGMIVTRFDNVASEAELAAAVDDVLG